jgi:hypothetical protein
MHATVYDTVQSVHRLTTWKFNTQPVSVDETEKTTFRIYPNPSGGEVRLVNFSPETHPWAITNLNGAVLKRGTCSGKETELNLELESGVYLFEQSNGRKVQREKLVIIK